jgi:precorrin-2 methylase
MRKVFVIGICAGNPDYVITPQAINALNEVDVATAAPRRI